MPTNMDMIDRVVRVVECNTSTTSSDNENKDDEGARPETIDADHIRLHLCGNGNCRIDEVNRGIQGRSRSGPAR